MGNLTTTPLTFEEEVFCREMVMTGSMLTAYRTAWAEGRDESDQTVYTKSQRKLSSGRISKRIAELQDSIARSLVADKARVLEEIAGIALLDPMDVVDDSGAVRQLKHIPRHARAAIKSMKFATEQYKEYNEATGEEETKFRTYTSEVEFWPKTTALDQLSKHLGLYAADHAQRNQKPTWENLPRDVRTMVMTELRKKVGKIGDSEQLATVDRSSTAGAGEGTTH